MPPEDPDHLHAASFLEKQMADNRPPPGTYVVQVPKDQVYRIPPQENAIKYDYLVNRGRTKKKFRHRCFNCIISMLILIAIVVGATYFIVISAAPRFSVVSLSVRDLNLSSSKSQSPNFKLSILAANRHHIVGIYCGSENSVKVYYDGGMMGSGNLPAFYQKPESETVYELTLSCAALELSEASRTKLGSNTLPLKFKFSVPVKRQVKSMKTWTSTIDSTCDVTVLRLTADSEILSQSCRRKIFLW